MLQYYFQMKKVAKICTKMNIISQANHFHKGYLKVQFHSLNIVGSGHGPLWGVISDIRSICTNTEVKNGRSDALEITLRKKDSTALFFFVFVIFQML